LYQHASLLHTKRVSFGTSSHTELTMRHFSGHVTAMTRMSKSSVVASAAACCATATSAALAGDGYPARRSSSAKMAVRSACTGVPG